MRIWSCSVWFWSTCLAFTVAAATAMAAPPADTLLPATTRGFVTADNYNELTTAWEKTQLGKLMDDPQMQAFTEDLKRQLRERLSESRERIGLAWEDLEGIPNGEVCGAIIHDGKSDPGVAMLVDVTDHLDKANELLDKVRTELAKQQAKRSEKTVGDTKIVIYELPPAEPDADTDPTVEPRSRKAVYFLKDNLLCASDNLAVAEDILGRFSGAAKGTLAGNEVYQAVMKRCQQDAKDQQPSVRWFAEPIALAEAIRGLDPTRRRVGMDYVKAMKKTGFEALRGAGGFVTLAAAPEHDILHRTAIFAPKPWEKSMNMLEFPNSGNLAPQDWVPADVAMYVSLNVDVQKAYDYFGPIFDETVGEGEPGVWADVVQSLEDDPNGPKINLKRDMIAHLGSRATIITDYETPITPDCERMLFAVEAKNEKALAEAIRKSMEPDPSVIKREFEGHVIWEIREAEVEAPDIDFGGIVPPAVENPGLPPLDAGDAIANEERVLPNSAVTVANGHLYVATHVDFLEKILHQDAERKKLADDADFKLVEAELARLGAKAEAGSFRAFTRTEEAFRPTYELVRQGKMPQSKTMFGTMLNRVLGGGKDAPPREQKIDPEKMPDYELVRPYLGPAGLFVVTEETGWFVVGATVNKSAKDATE
ncbi:MAG: hypothetical protein KF708_05760 [Pirellulales bacterium]|nr:hypothetical protein [Pirellulales bacterium]